MNPIPPLDPEDEVLAAEHALGLLDGAARQEAEARRSRDPAFAAAVDAWTMRLDPLLAGVAEVEPSAGLWPRVRAALGSGEVIDLAARRAANRGGEDVADRSSSRWRGWVLAAAGVAAVLLLGVLARRPPAPQAPALPPVLIATLVDTAGGGTALASYDPLRRQVLAQMPNHGREGARVAELWLIGPDGRPRALGVAGFGRVASLRLPEDMATRMRTGSVLAVSVEPAGGSPTGLPTGPVVAKGALQPA